VPGKAVTAGKSVFVGLGDPVNAIAVSVAAIVVAVLVAAIAVAVSGRSVLVAVGNVPVGVTLGVFVAVVVSVGVSVGPATQTGPKTLFESRVTSPTCVRARPFRLAPVWRWMASSARMFPMNEVFAPSVPAETSLHQMLHGSPPVTLEPAEVVSVAADLKIQTPAPLRVRFPVSKNASAQQVPGPRGETRVRSCTPS
jgi:hypothetical protein